MNSKAWNRGRARAIADMRKAREEWQRVADGATDEDVRRDALEQVEKLTRAPK